MSSKPFDIRTIHSLFDLDDMGGLTLPMGVFVRCGDGCLEVDRPIRYSVDEPIPPLYVSSGSKSLVIRERAHCRHTGRRFVVTVEDKAILSLAYTRRGWICRQIAGGGKIADQIGQHPPAVPRKPRQLESQLATEHDWGLAPDNEAVFRGPYAGYRFVELDRFGHLRHCRGDRWNITSPEPINFFVRSTSFYKRAGHGEPLYVRFRGGVVHAYQVVAGNLYVANVANLRTWPPTQPPP